MNKFAVVTPWHNPDQLRAFLNAWRVEPVPDWLFLTEDVRHEGCAKTKNRGIRDAIDRGAEMICVLDDDCYPEECISLERHVDAHWRALQPTEVTMFAVVTNPQSRGTPYYDRTITMPVAASMGFWRNIPDYDAPSQLVHGNRVPEFRRIAINGVYFPLSGMNIAFRASEWPWCQFVNVPRFDDIWGGWLWQRKAYADGKCFNLCGPLVSHARQSNVFANLQAEAPNMQRNETLWRNIATEPLQDYPDMLVRHNLAV